VTAAAEALDALQAVREPGAAAALAAEALRALNHLTLPAPSPGVPGWEEVGDSYRVLGELYLLAERLPQAVEQLSRHLERSARRGCYRSDDGTRESPETLVVRAVVALEAAQVGAQEVGSQLAAAQSAVAHLSAHT
jgi:hypothetical protein